MPEINKGDILKAACPRCNGDLVVRQNRTQLNLFVGCHNYFTAVQCRFSRQILKDDEVLKKAPVVPEPTSVPGQQDSYYDELEPDDRDPFAKEDTSPAQGPLDELAKMLSPLAGKRTRDDVRTLLTQAVASVVRVVCQDYITSDQAFEGMMRTLERLGNDGRLRAKDNHCGHTHDVVLLKER